MNLEITDAFWALLGAIALEGYKRFKNRLTTLHWRVVHERFAASGEDKHFGKVEVVYNGQPTDNIFTTRFEIINPTNRDLEDLSVRVAFNSGVKIRSGRANLEGELFDVSLEVDDFSVPSIARVSVPVLNRSTVVTVGFLVEADQNVQPFLVPTCLKKGVKLTQQPAPTLLTSKLFGVDIGRAAVVGLAAVVVVVVSSIYMFSVSVEQLLFGVILGLTSTVIGAALVRAWRWVLQIFG